MTMIEAPTEFEFPALKECLAKIDAKSKELHDIFDEAGPDLDMSKVKSVAGGKDGAVAQIRELNKELEDLGTERDGLIEIAKGVKFSRARDADDADGHETGGETSARSGAKSLGDLFVESKAYTGRVPGGNGAVDTLDLGAPELKTLMETSAGWAPESVRTGRLVEFATRPIQVIDIIPMGATGQAAVVYMEETTFTNNAAETAEGGAYGEAAFALTEQTSAVRKIAVWLPITDEQLEDEPQVRGYVNNRLPFMLRQRLDLQLLVGDGTPPNLSGIHDRVGIQTQAKGADPTPDAVYKAMTKVRVTGQAMPNAYITHPNDWQDIRLLRTSDGIYIWGSPSEAGPERIWGLQVVQAQAETENTGLVGDFANHCEFAMRRGVEIQVSNSHSDYFVKGKQAVRADLRGAFQVFRPSAFATVTGI